MTKNLVIFSLLVSLLLSATSVRAFTVPEFPSCSAPSGSVISDYNSGIHGIPGDAATYTGSDKVFQVTENNVLQCFCPTDGNTGIQSNWWKISDLSQSDIAALQKQGWIFIPSGSEWGLSADPYLAKNISFSCSGPTPTPAPTSVPGGNGGPAGAPVCTDEVPPAPTLISVTRSGTEATLIWSNVIQATHYTISYGYSKDNMTFGVPNTGKVTSYTIGALEPGKEYFFEVRAVNVCAPSAPSSPAGQVLGAAVGGAELAATGTLPVLVGTTVAAVIFFALSLFARRYHRVH